MTGPCLERELERSPCGRFELRRSPASEFSPLLSASMNDLEPSDPSSFRLCAWKISLYYTNLPSHASNMMLSKPPEYVARYGVGRLMTCCSHRRSSRVLVLFDLGMRLGALPTCPFSHRADSLP